MITFILIAGVILLVFGGVFFWLNLNSPVQTCIPALAIPAGLCFLIGACGMLL